MKGTFALAGLGSLLVIGSACGGGGRGGHGDAQADASAPSPGAGREPDASRWTRSVGSADHAQLVALPDGDVLLVTVTENAASSGARVQLRAIDPDGELRWEQAFEGGSLNLPWEAPAVAVDAHGDIYLTLGTIGSPGVTLGEHELDCPAGCGGVASFGPDGEPRWLVDVANMQDHFMTAVEEGVVLAMAFGEAAPVLMGISSDGDRLWDREWPLPYVYPPLAGVLAGDRGGGFYLAGRKRPDGVSGRSQCGALARHSALDGSMSWERVVCGEELAIEDLSNLVVLDDGTLVALASDGTERAQLMGFARDGERRFVTELAAPIAMWTPSVTDMYARPRAVHGGAAVLAAPQIGPLAAVDAEGMPLWQWPGALEEGAFTTHPSGLCQGSVAPAPGGELYVLSVGCVPARALLGAQAISEQWSGSEEEFPYEEWFLARVDVETAAESAPRCGNGYRDPGEACDGEDFEVPGLLPDGQPRPTLCQNFHAGAGWTGAPACTSACRIDLSPCASSCGNGRLDEDEGCDGDLFRWAQSCDDADLGSGPLGCNDCVVDLSVCPMRASCGNGVLEPWETCDGFLSRPEEGPPTCEEAGIGTGLIGCTDDCRERDYTTCEQ